MSLRTSFAIALRFLRTRRQVSQRSLAESADPSYVSRLESGERSVTLEASASLAVALRADPLSLITLTYAAELGLTPREVLANLHKDLAAAELLDVELLQELIPEPHPVVAQANALNAKILELVAQGLSQSEVARRLGVSRVTVGKHLRR
ncbi:helix-turn-helix domain-containing protein [Pseudomonas syringae]|uniref:helix-turn-helix domain-containing protein n=1 Tax=Pseudomonas syringae TaxID=317 RepID=UPI000466890F|nr:helix-turn-helix transcriptional regulator [Pseudomonas syringae]